MRSHTSKLGWQFIPKPGQLALLACVIIFLSVAQHYSGFADRTEGRAMQSVIVGGECENCREDREQRAQALSGLTDQELETIREILERSARAHAAHEG